MAKETCKNILNTIQYPEDLRKLRINQLPQLCDELRQFVINELSQNPGHFGSTLGVIELTVALHYVYNTPNDRLVWDVGHQAYAHKILTGRREQFHTNRKFKGLKPFPSPEESEYDSFTCGHASNSISAALGMAVAAKKQGDDKRRVVITTCSSFSTTTRCLSTVRWVDSRNTCLASQLRPVIISGAIALHACSINSA